MERYTVTYLMVKEENGHRELAETCTTIPIDRITKDTAVLIESVCILLSALQGYTFKEVRKVELETTKY